MGADHQQERPKTLLFLESSETIRQAPSTEYPVKIESELHGDMQRLAEMTSPWSMLVSVSQLTTDNGQLTKDK